MSKTAIIIPARFNSSRFPGKSLQLLDAYSVIQTVYMRASEVKNIDLVQVVTDDERILNNIKQIGGEAVLSEREHINGTSRISEIAENLDGFDFILNLQGDEPLIDPCEISRLVELLKASNSRIVTLKKRIYENQDIENPNVVKVVCDNKANALYFSRSKIPYSNDVHSMPSFKHIGIYGFHKLTLLDIVKLPQTDLEIAESLEQLRWLQNGYSIKVLETEHDSIGIDVPADLEMAKKVINEHRF